MEDIWGRLLSVRFCFDKERIVDVVHDEMEGNIQNLVIHGLYSEERRTVLAFLEEIRIHPSPEEKLQATCRMLDYIATDGLPIFVERRYPKFRSVCLKKMLVEWWPHPQCHEHSPLRYAIRRLMRNATETIFETEHPYLEEMSTLDALQWDNRTWIFVLPAEIISDFLLPLLGDVTIYKQALLYEPLPSIKLF